MLSDFVSQFSPNIHGMVYRVTKLNTALSTGNANYLFLRLGIEPQLSRLQADAVQLRKEPCDDLFANT